MSSCSSSSSGRWSKLQRMLSRPSYFGNETGTLPNGLYEPGQHLFERIQSAQQPSVLVVGAGGLGCEILKVAIVVSKCQPPLIPDSVMYCELRDV
eukprot:gene40490-54753_t